MKTAPLLTFAAGAALALTLAGCAAPATSGASTPTTPDAARELLVENVNGAAGVIGDFAQDTYPNAVHCVTESGDGVQFSYVVDVPDSNDSPDTLNRVAAFWSSKGIQARVSEGKVSQTADGVTPADSPVWSIVATPDAGIVQIVGYSHCMPGDALEYMTPSGERQPTGG